MDVPSDCRFVSRVLNFVSAKINHPPTISKTFSGGSGHKRRRLGQNVKKMSSK